MRWVLLPWPRAMTAMAGLAAMGVEDLVLDKDKNVLRLLGLWNQDLDHVFNEVICSLFPEIIEN